MVGTWSEFVLCEFCGNECGFIITHLIDDDDRTVYLLLMTTAPNDKRSSFYSLDSFFIFVPVIYRCSS